MFWTGGFLPCRRQRCQPHMRTRLQCQSSAVPALLDVHSLGTSSIIHSLGWIQPTPSHLPSPPFPATVVVDRCPHGTRTPSFSHTHILSRCRVNQHWRCVVGCVCGGWPLTTSTNAAQHMLYVPVCCLTTCTTCERAHDGQGRGLLPLAPYTAQLYNASSPC